MKKFLCKAILSKNKASNTGVDWITSRRCLLHVGDDYLKAGSVKVAFYEIENAYLRIVPSAFFISSCILSVETNTGENHHFGLIYSSFWKKDLPFKIERIKVTVPNIWMRRLVIIGAFLFLIWTFVKDKI